VPYPARAMSNVVPPPALTPLDTASPFAFITRDTSERTKNEIFGIGRKKEKALFTALIPRESSVATMTALSEFIIDGTALPGTYAGADDALLEQEEAESGNKDLAETISAALNITRGRQGIWGNTGRLDTTWRTRRISLKSVKTADDLHTLERNLGHAITDAIENMELAFGSVLDSFQWTDERLDQYFTGGLLPFIGIRSMRLYADLVRDLACRATSWERTKRDIKYFYDKLYRIRTTAPSRLMLICRTYVCLREQKAAHFQSLDRYAAHFTSLYSRLDQQQGESAAAPSCARCKQSNLHLGGRGGCPFKSIPEAKARLAGTFAAEQVASGMTKTRAYEAALADVQ
jgi:hypothetical protein